MNFNLFLFSLLVLFFSCSTMNKIQTFVPANNESENSTQFLTQIKYQGLKFIGMPRPRCSKHYPLSDAFFVNYESGILINYYNDSTEVISVSWMLKEDLIRTVEKVSTYAK